MADARILPAWLVQNPLGRYLRVQENLFFQAALTDRQPENLLLLGAAAALFDLAPLPALAVHQASELPADVLAGSLKTPWPDAFFDCVLAAHPCYQADQAAVFLAEMHRIVCPQGCLLLTGFNPHSLWRLDVGRRRVPDVSGCLPLPVLKPHLAAAGWHIESGRFLNYLPPVRSERAVRLWNFMEAAGNRWWPHAAAVYALVLSKRVAAPILPERSPQNVLLPEAAFGLSRQGAASACTTEPR